MARPPSSLPTNAELLRFIKDSDGKIDKREICRAFGIKGQDRIYLKKLIKSLIEEGLVERRQGRRLQTAGSLPSVGVIIVTGTDPHGDVIARPQNWDGDEAPPIIHIAPDTRRQVKSLGEGDRALARLERTSVEPFGYQARVIKVLDSAPSPILGIFRKSGKESRIVPVDKRSRNEFTVAHADEGGAKDGELVSAIQITQRRHLGLKQARVTERLGDISEPRSISRVAIHAHGIPDTFPEDVVKEAETATAASNKGREDLRDLPLITIDPEDARDHDDALWAEADPDPANKGGWHVIVAIADVAHYVRPDSPMDREARKRGNSCYFPDRVVPMLPEALSTDLCSLKPGVDRAALGLHMWFDANGNKKRHKFTRVIMRSAGHVTYGAAQSAIDGMPDATTEPLLDPVLRPLYAAYAARKIEREKRSPLDLDMPERKIILGKDGAVKDIRFRERLDLHRLVEEFMIAANVCAAEELERHRSPCMYRVQEEPSLEKMESLREFLRSLDFNLAKGQVLRPSAFNRVLSRFAESPHEHLVNQVVLRSQSQANYSPDNLGHFGLALSRYAHFTSPIRRYADVLVHRSLIRALKLGSGGLTDEEAQEFSQIGDAISTTERRAMVAERDTTDRYMAAYLANRIGNVFEGRISGVNRFGLFVTLEPSGGDGLVPVSSLTDDFYRHDETTRALIGDRTGRKFRLGDEVEVKLLEAVPVTGGLRLELAGDDAPAGLPNFVTRGKHRKGGKKNKRPTKRRRK